MKIREQSEQASISQGYFSESSPQDECFGLGGEAKEHWQKLMKNIHQLGIDELKIRQQELLKLLRENGVTYNVYGDPNGLNRPWMLDTMPLIISTDEWQGIEKGLKQRAYVLNKVLQDLYGERTLIKKGILPAELIYGHSGFLRPCSNSLPPNKNRLILYASDLSRGPDGRIWVLKDRTQAPSGMGYALENRRALSRIAPELFHEYDVARLGSFFQSLIHALHEISPMGKEQPRIVLLTPGPRNETYFEHAFLASYLGLTLVQGDDLVVRNSFVWIKTVEGLEKVDIILRRVDDTYCDPLELREDSQLGIPGLLEAIRKGNVAMANPLGTGILENTGLMAFMHTIMRYYLQEDPILSMVATWWCGQKKEMEHVIHHIDKLVIKRTDRLLGSNTVIGGMLNKAEKENLIRSIKAYPYLYVGQEEVGFSTSPVFTNDRLEARLSVLRTYAVASGGDYSLMQGGLTRSSQEKGSFLVSNQDGGISKDTWVEGVEKNFGVEDQYQYTADYKRKNVLPSRAAENLFWVGRYSQRVLRTARYIRIVLRSLGQNSLFEKNTELISQQAMLQAITNLTGTHPGFFDDNDTWRNPLAELHTLVSDRKKVGSIVFSLDNLLKSMYAVRNRWSLDNWSIIEEVESINRKLGELEEEELRQVFTLLDDLNISLLSFSGMNRESMYREEGWLLYRIGKTIENCLLELSQYRSLLVPDYGKSAMTKILELVLISNQNLTNYRSVYRTYFDILPVIDLLFFNRQNPSSLIYQLNELLELVKELPHKEANANDSVLAKIAFEAYSTIHLTNIEKLVKVETESEAREALDILCTTLSTLLVELASKVNANYFSFTTYRYQGSKRDFQFDV